MLLFRSEEAVEAWCRRRGHEVGGVMTLETTWELSRRWYGDRLDPGFRGRTPAAAMAIFRSVGLTGPFWTF